MKRPYCCVLCRKLEGSDVAGCPVGKGDAFPSQATAAECALCVGQFWELHLHRWLACECTVIPGGGSGRCGSTNWPQVSMKAVLGIAIFYGP